MTGAGGGLGRAFLAAAGDGNEMHPFTRQELDVRSLEAVTEVLVPIEPDVIMHFAAMTALDACEEDPSRAFDTNVTGSRNVAEAAKRTGALLVAISTDYVFDGEKGEPYDERDRANPISAYGRTKHEGEQAVQAVGPEALIVRTAWIYGAGNEFASKAVRRLAAGEEVGAIADQVGSPTHVVHLAERLLPLVSSGVLGVVHLAGPEAASWHDVLVRAKELGDLPGDVIAKKADELDRPAKRPPYSALTSVRLDESKVPPMPSLDDGIRRVLADVGG